MVSSKLITACHRPPGTKTVSPGYCINYFIPSYSREYFSFIFGRISAK